MVGVLFPIRTIGPIPVDMVIEESIEAEMEIPEHPVERGAKLTDHAYRKPTILKMTTWSENPLIMWQLLYRLFQSAEPFAMLNGFDFWSSLLIQKLEPKRDVETGQILALECTLKEIIVVDTAYSAGGGAEAGNQGTGGDERGQAMTERGQVQARSIDTSGGRGEAVLASLEAV